MTTRSFTVGRRGVKREVKRKRLSARERLLAYFDGEPWRFHRKYRDGVRRLPLYHDRFPLSGLPDTTSLLPTGYHRWEIGYSSQSKACRDSGLAWCRNPANFGAWRPGAQIVPFRSGYAAPGQYVTVDSILVSSFSWPFALWGRAWTDVPGRWTYITERADNQ